MLSTMISMSPGESFDLFISYRVWCDKEFAESLFKAASKCPLRGPDARMRVYLDKVRLVDGQRFDIGFIKGLASSTVFAPLISASCVKSFVDLGKEDREDFVLMEWIVAIELHKRGIVEAIFPITIEAQETGKKDGTKDGQDGLFSQFFFEELRDDKVNGQPLPDVVSPKSVAKAREFLSMLDEPVELTEELTVRAVVRTILKFQAALLHFNNASLAKAVSGKQGEQARSTARQLAATDCAERVAKIVAAKQPRASLARPRISELRDSVSRFRQSSGATAAVAVPLQ